MPNDNANIKIGYSKNETNFLKKEVIVRVDYTYEVHTHT